MTYYERLTIDNRFRSPFVESLAYEPRLELGSVVLEVRRTQCHHCLGRVRFLDGRYVWVAATRRTSFDSESPAKDHYGDPYAALLTPAEDARGVTLYAQCRCKHGFWGIPGPWLAEQMQSSRRSPVAGLDTDKVPPAPEALRFDDC